MNTKDMVLRNENPVDYDKVDILTREAFWNHHEPGCNEHYLIHIMRAAESFIPELDFVAEVNEEIVGNIVYTHGKVVGDDGIEHNVISFGPISVLPAFQRNGIGSSLIEHTKALAKELGYTAILIYGDPDYYGKFGFVAAENYRIGTSDNMYATPLLALELVTGALSNISGRFLEDEIYEIDENEANGFDKRFEPKELCSGSTSQKRFSELVGMCKPRG